MVTIGWRGDPDIYMTDGTTLFEQLADGRVEVTGWSRRAQMSTEVYPDLRDAVQEVVNAHLVREARLELSRRGLYEAVHVTHPEGGERPIPPEGRWPVVVSAHTVLFGTTWRDVDDRVPRCVSGYPWWSGVRANVRGIRRSRARGHLWVRC